jgi:hypothetical protein
VGVGLPTAEQRWAVTRGDAVEWLRSLPNDSVDLLFTSPPYELARTYGLDTMVGGQAWVDWMVAVVKAAAPKVKGLIAIVCEGQTRNYRNSCVPFLLIADLHRAGFNLRKPPIYKRVGIPGSGGPDWLRNDYEPIVCVTRPGRLPWSDNTACGHPPKWAPGGEMSHRLTSGMRINQWGQRMTGCPTTSRTRKADGTMSKSGRPSHKTVTLRRATPGAKDGDTTQSNGYAPPVLANPGNVIGCSVGGGAMGHDCARENEAPFPLKLAEFFVRSFCPPDGLVADCFCGSGTTGHAALVAGRRFAGCDVRQSQVELSERRLQSGITPDLFARVE